MSDQKNKSIKKVVNPTRLGVIGNDILNHARSTFESIPKHSADVILPEQKIKIVTKNKK